MRTRRPRFATLAPLASCLVPLATALALLATPPPLASGFEFKARLVREGSSRITGLTWNDVPPKAFLLPSSADGASVGAAGTALDRRELVVKVQGIFRPKGSGWTLLLNDKVMAVGADGGFEINFAMKGKSQSVEVTAVGDDGSLESETVGVELEDFDAIVAHLSASPTPAAAAPSPTAAGAGDIPPPTPTGSPEPVGLMVSAQLGYAEHRYSQRNVKTVSQKLATVGASYVIPVVDELVDACLGGDVSLPGSASSPPIGRLTYFEGDALLTTRLPFVPPGKESVQTHTGLGVFLKSMSVTPSRFGYSSTFGLLLEQDVRSPAFAGNVISARVTFGFVATDFDNASDRRQRLQRATLRWSRSWNERLDLHAEAAAQQFRLLEGNVNERRGGLAIGVGWR